MISLLIAAAVAGGQVNSARPLPPPTVYYTTTENPQGATRWPRGMRYVAGGNLDEPAPWWEQWWVIAFASVVTGLVGATALRVIGGTEDEDWYE